jgi:hypothetical protein
VRLHKPQKSTKNTKKHAAFFVSLVYFVVCRAFERMPELADALAEAGCSNPDILSHCHGPGPHVRGCWVVDLLGGGSGAGEGVSEETMNAE